MKKIAMKLTYILAILSIILTANSTINTKAAEPQLKWIAITESCPRCRKSVMSYGINENFSSRNFSFFEGERCEYCNRIVEKGYSHQTHKARDLYYFRCTCGNTWTDYGDWHYYSAKEDVTRVN